MAEQKTPKQTLADLLAQDIPQGPIQRGQGMRTSFEDAAAAAAAAAKTAQPGEDMPPPTTIAPSQDRKSAIVRINRGYKLREDYIKRCKQIALDEDRHLYEIMEEALEIYLNTHKKPEEF